MLAQDRFHDFFVASAGVAGALVGLLFVAVSVTVERMAERGETQVHRVRAAAALSAFSNALVISLFAVVPGVSLGWVAVAVSATGLSHLSASLLSLLRLRIRRPSDLTDALFLGGLGAAYVVQLLTGLRLTADEHSVSATDTIAVLVVVCFVIGITRSWELIGGPTIGMGGELLALSRKAGVLPGGANESVQPCGSDRGARGAADDASAGVPRDASAGVPRNASAGVSSGEDGGASGADPSAD